MPPSNPPPHDGGKTHYNILSIDGGGLRGLISAIWLEELENQLKAHDPSASLRSHFHFLAGASTGSILALGLAAGKSDKEMRQLYLDHAKVIFPRRCGLGNWGLLGPKYERDGLEDVLKSAFGTLTLGDLDDGDRTGRPGVPVMVPSYDMRSNLPVFFKSWKPEFASVPVWQIAAASSSGPSYFAPTRTLVEGRHATLVDGGVVMNNPVAGAVIEAMTGKPFRTGTVPAENLRVLSLGTGSYDADTSYHDIASRGIFGWMKAEDNNIVDVLFDASSDSMTYMAANLLPRACPSPVCPGGWRKDHHHRLIRWQVDLPFELKEMADSRDEALAGWSRIAQQRSRTLEFAEDIRRVISW